MLADRGPDRGGCWSAHQVRPCISRGVTVMPLRDYEALDEDDFYGQGFERPGVVSVWLGTEPPGDVDPNLDVLQDLCGVGYYSLDSNEVNVLAAASPIEAMLGPMSYSESYLPAVLK